MIGPSSQSWSFSIEFYVLVVSGWCKTTYTRYKELGKNTKKNKNQYKNQSDRSLFTVINLKGII